MISEPFARHHRYLLLEKHKTCSCYHCLQVYSPEEITHWIDSNQTAICPHCFVDAVLPGRIPINELKALKEKWFDVGFKKH